LTGIQYCVVLSKKFYKEKAMENQYFTEEHEMFRKSLRSFIEKELAPHADKWEEAHDFPNDIFKKLGDFGLLGLKYEKKYGGAEADYWYTVVFCEEIPRCMSAGVTLATLVQTDMATPMVHYYGTDEQKMKYLAPAIRGEKIFALGVSEANSGSDVASIRTTAKKDGDYYIINGSKMFITNGARADYITLAAKTNPEAGHQGISFFIFDTKTKGFAVGRKLKKMGHLASDTAELFFEDCRIHKSCLLGEEGQGFYQIMRSFQGERMVAAVTGVASAEMTLEHAIKYAQERVQFGKPISKFQVIKHKLVDMAIGIEACKQLTYHCAWMHARGMDCVKEISMAKVMVGEVANKVAFDAVQIHGGYGYMDEYPVSRMYRDARLIPIGGGTSEMMKEIISKLMGI
jgi:citronellyl-CoA dehydrogenase